MSHDPRPSFSSGRKWTFSLNVAIASLAVLALVLMVNYLAARHFTRFPLSGKAQTQFSPITHRVLAGLTNDVRVVVYFDKDEALYDWVMAILKEYKFANGRISVEAVDPERDAAAANLIKAKYKLSQKNLIIFDSGGRTKFVYDKELSDVDIQSLVSGQSREVRRTHFKGEMLFTSALMNVTMLRQLKAYFLQGHGEHRPDSDDKLMGYSKFTGVLQENNIQFETLALRGTAEVPADCQLLIIAGPVDPLLQEELDKIDRYLNQGGRLFVLFNFNSLNKQTGLEKILANWGVAVGNNVVLDKENSITGNDMVVAQFGNHPLVKPLQQSRGIYLVLPRSVTKAQLGKSNADAPQVEALASTSDKGRIITDIRAGLTMYESPNDIVGAIQLMAAVEKGSIRGVKDRGSTRLVVLGESIFLGNETIGKMGNHDFASHAINWLLDRNDLLVGLAPRPIKEYKLDMTDSQRTAASWILLLGMPGAVMLLGLLVWFRRRH